VAIDFKGFWSETLPLLTPSFVKVFNEAYVEDLTALPLSDFSDISIGDNVEKHDLLAEFSFCLAEISNYVSVPVDSFKGDGGRINEAYGKAVEFLKRYKNETNEIVLNQYEIDESFLIAMQYGDFFEYLDVNDVVFRPIVKGAGFLRGCAADLSVGDTLYEIKTVSRNLAGKDIRQLLVYLALESSNNNNRWVNAGFFNPRKALHYKFSVDHLIYRTSGGRSTIEVFQDIIDFLSYRDVEIDTIF